MNTPEPKSRATAAPEIRPLRVEHAREAGAMLGRAFCDNAGYRAILAHYAPGARLAAVSRAKRGFAEAAIRYQQAEGIWDGERLVAASLVAAPGQFPIALRAFAWHARGVLPSGPRAVRKFLYTDFYMSRRHPREPHYYLFVLGVEPAQQGRGLGRTLLHALSARADAARLPCYLETDRESAMMLYRSVGYEVVSDERVPVADFRMWTMRRPPLREG
jgi:GNAT superfamily N-acetyltransferase